MGGDLQRIEGLARAGTGSVMVFKMCIYGEMGHRKNERRVDNEWETNV